MPPRSEDGWRSVPELSNEFQSGNCSLTSLLLAAYGRRQGKMCCRARVFSGKAQPSVRVYTRTGSLGKILAIDAGAVPASGP